MSNKKKPSRGFQERTTMAPEGVTITRPLRNTPKPPPDPTKHFVGADHKPTEEEALEMGRKLYDAIQVQLSKRARGSK
jgi:hypothetical protein